MKNSHSVPFNIPSIGENEIREVIAALRSGWITTGPRTQRFEEKLANYVGATHAVAVNSCTAGLHLALVAHDIHAGDEVVTTPFTFAATAAVVIHCGAKPTLVDIQDTGFNIDPARVEAAITSHTKAIIPVHFAGEPCMMDEILSMARHHGLCVIEDAAHALGAKYKERRVGSIGDVTVFSFYATKNLTTGEGGMVTTENEELAERMRSLSLHGLSRDAWRRYSREGSWYYEICEPGYKYNMSDIQAAIGLQQLERFDGLQQKRTNLASYYHECLTDIEEVLLPHPPGWVEHAWHLYVIRVDFNKLSIDRNDFIELLREKGVGTSVHFIPLHLHPYYRQAYGYVEGDFPNAEKAYHSSISLPLYPQMTLEDVESVAKAIRRIISKNRRVAAVPVREEIC